MSTSRWKHKLPKTSEQLLRHAAVSAAVRYDIDLTAELAARIVRCIQCSSGAAPCVKFREKQSQNRTHFEVEIDGKWVRVVYDKKRKCIATFLPMSETFEFPKAPDGGEEL